MNIQKLINNSFVASLHLAWILVTPNILQASEKKIDGYVGQRIDACIANQVMAQDTHILVEPFRHLTEGNLWQSEFVGKWMLGAIASYRYNQDPALLKKITETANDLMSTQHENGYIGNYKEEDRLTGWDIWGRKYTALALLDFYKLTSDKNAIMAVSKLIDGLISEIEKSGKKISDTGNYRGMPSCSILEPVVYLYELTGESRYLDFAKSIVDAIESPGAPNLVSKALADVDVAHRYEDPVEWWSFENGHKAYEMMSCYVGLIELGRVTGESSYLKAAEAVADNIIRNEINIAGSGAAFECWYDGRHRQTIPTYHTMETCVTFTWMQLCHHLWECTGKAKYAEEFERTAYNALMASLKDDAMTISKYSPIEGRRQPGEQQCGLPINCCNANGPRGFALIPEMATVLHSDTLYVNLYLQQNEVLDVKGRKISISIKSDFPVSGKSSFTISSSKRTDLVVALRVPSWANGNFQFHSKNKSMKLDLNNGYIFLDCRDEKDYAFDVEFPLSTQLLELNGMQAIIRGPLVYARDNRFNDGDVDECCIVKVDNEGNIESRFVDGKSNFAWNVIEVPAILGTDLENPDNSRGRMIRLCDFASAGNDWSPQGRYRVWLPKTLNAMTEPYHKY